MSYHCSLSAIGAGAKSSGGRKFIPPPRKIIQVPWNTPQQMMEHVGFHQGEWVLSTNQVGHIQGLPHITGAVIARRGNKRMLWRADNSVMVICASNFVGHYEEPEPPPPEVDEEWEKFVRETVARRRRL